MRRFSLLILVISFLLPATAGLAQETGPLQTGNWTFEVKSAVKAPFFMDTIHLGALDDGRDWLAVTMVISNSTSKNQEIHSDKIRLRLHDELIKQTGDESETAASELGYRSIGGSFPHDIEAGAVFEVVQVFKVDPAATDLVLVFDFNGEWELPISNLISQSAGDPRHLVIDSDVSALGPVERLPWSVETASYSLTLVGAVLGPTFSEPFHLGSTGDGREWLVATYRFENLTSDGTELKADSHKLLVGGEEVKQATDETQSVSDELGLGMLTFELPPGETVEIVQVFKVDSSERDFTLQISARGKLFIDLSPAVSQSSGNANAILPGAPDSPVELPDEVSDVNAVPTERTTPTQVVSSELLESSTGEQDLDEPESTSVPTTGPSDGESQDDWIIVELVESEGSGVSGDATLRQTGNGETQIDILVDGASGAHPTFIQAGDCANRGELLETLPDVDSSGGSLATVSIQFADLARGRLGPSIIAIYSTWPNAEVLLACGEIENSSSESLNDGSEIDGAEAAYGLEIYVQTQIMSASLNRVAELSVADNLFSASWKQEVADEIAIWNQIHAEATALVPPPRLAGVHSTYVEALSHFVVAGEELAYGIDNFDVDAINRATLEMEAGAELLSQATEELDDLEE